jgi:geranylgeranyl diphosphate synthase, type I
MTDETALKQELKVFLEKFEPFLRQQLDILKTESESFNFEYQFCYSEIDRVASISGAKRIRPFLVYMGYKLGKNNIDQYLSTQEWDDILNVGLGLELFHTSALIFDDIIDEAETRRGENTIQVAYTKYFEKKLPQERSGRHQHHSLSGTLLAGMLAQSIGDRYVCQIDNLEIRNHFFTMQRELIAGQIDDCFGIGMSDFVDLEREKILTMMKTKSGNYSVQKPLQIGMLLAGVENNSFNFNEVSIVGEQLGIVFQLIDDILGIFGDEEITGKSASGDILEGKRTLLIENLYRVSNFADKNRVINIVGNPYATDQDISWIKNKLKQIGIYDYHIDWAKKLTDDSVNRLNKINLDGAAILVEFADYLLTRQK